MTTAEIRSKVAWLTRIAAWARTRIVECQSECSHANTTSDHKSNVGNYDPSADCYWTEHTCQDCGKHWSVNH